MHNLIKSLKEEMTQEWDAYSALLVLAREKKQAIIINKIERINEILQLEETLLKQIQELSALQAGIMQSICEQSGKQNPVLTEIIGMVTDENEKQELLKLQKDFQKLVRDLQWENDLNRKLLHMQLQYANLSLSYLYGDDAAGNMYANTGHVSGEIMPRRGFIDQEV